MNATALFSASIQALLVGNPGGSGADHGFRTTIEWTAPNGVEERQFGRSVAIGPRWIAVSSDHGEDGSFDPGSIVLYPGDRPRGARSVRISAPDRKWPDEFGAAIEFSGEWLLVGAPGDSERDWDSGAAWLFEHRGDWHLRYALKPPGIRSGDRFGDSVAIDGEWLAVGAPRSDRGAIDTGAVHVFEREGERWIQREVLVAPDGEMSDFFGDAIAMWGPWLAVGSWADDDRGEKTGSVWVFHREPDRWRPVQKIVPAGARARGRLGCSLAFTEGWLLAGASGWDGDRGAIHAFRLEESRWIPSQRLTAPEGSEGDWLGFSLDAAGRLLVAGAPGRRRGDRTEGAIELFVLDGGGWRWRQSVAADHDPRQQPNQFGWSLGTDGRRIVVGRIDDADGPPEPGRAWLVEELPRTGGGPIGLTPEARSVHRTR